MRRPRKSMNQINVVPYIDVMLVLLIIFMVAAPLINPGQIDLPSVGQKLNPAVAPDSGSYDATLQYSGASGSVTWIVASG